MLVARAGSGRLTTETAVVPNIDIYKLIELHNHSHLMLAMVCIYFVRFC